MDRSLFIEAMRMPPLHEPDSIRSAVTTIVRETCRVKGEKYRNCPKSILGSFRKAAVSARVAMRERAREEADEVQCGLF